jgi:uncharacterized protein
VPYGEEITAEKLSAIDEAEQLLIDLGFRQVRVRMHGEIARIEIDRDLFPRLLQPETAQSVSAAFRRLGFRYAALDLEGYRTGSMNDALKG